MRTKIRWRYSQTQISHNVKTTSTILPIGSKAESRCP